MKRRELITAAMAAAAASTVPVRLARRSAVAADSYGPVLDAKADADKRDFASAAKHVYERHFAQSQATVEALRRKYAQPVFGPLRVWDLLEKLALCVDVTDEHLGCTNQLIHVQQVVEGMERDGVQDMDMFLAALTHDLGKILLLTGEAPENVMCANRPIGEFDPGAGLDRVVFQWNHDEFIYSRLRDHLPEHVGWLVRYHSIAIDAAAPYMNARDLDFTERYLRPFRKYDMGTKSVWHLPPPRILEKYRDLLEKTFPGPIPV